MHSIERYGIVALLFLIVTVVAVLLWDGDKGKKAEKKASLPETVATRVEPPPARAPASGDAPVGTLRLEADPVPGPLLHTEPEPQPAERTVAPEAESFEPAPLTRETVMPVRPESARDETLRAGDEPAAAAPLRAADEPAAKPAQEAPAATHAYVVGPGDTLSEIALKELGSSKRWQEILAVNPGLDPSRLHVGKELRIPGAGASGTKTAKADSSAKKGAPAPQPAVASEPAATWKVGPGENLWKIAEKTLGDGKRWKEIAALNKGIDPDRVKQGTTLKLPATARKAAAPKKNAEAPVVASTADSRGSSRRGGKVQ